MIFLTVGTQDPFDRLVRAVDQWASERACGDRVFGQVAEGGGYLPSSFDWVPRLVPSAYTDRCRGAELIISHAGMGSIITAMRLGKPIVIMPRREHLGEQRNDHQWATARRFADRPGIFSAMTEVELAGILDDALSQGMTGIGGGLGSSADEKLIRSIRSVILGEGRDEGSLGRGFPAGPHRSAGGGKPGQQP